MARCASGMPAPAASAVGDLTRFSGAPPMSERNTVVRSLHDLGLAAWFGGSLAGAVGFNGAAADVPDEKLRLRVANAAWARWTPVNLVGIGAHLVGGAGILYANRDRVAAQQGVGTSTVAKAALTGAALAVTGYSRVLGKKLEKADGEPVEGGTDPSAATSPDVAKVQRQLKVCQWLVPGVDRWDLRFSMPCMASSSGRTSRCREFWRSRHSSGRPSRGVAGYFCRRPRPPQRSGRSDVRPRSTSSPRRRNGPDPVRRCRAHCRPGTATMQRLTLALWKVGDCAGGPRPVNRLLPASQRYNAGCHGGRGPSSSSSEVSNSTLIVSASRYC